MKKLSIALLFSLLSSFSYAETVVVVGQVVSTADVTAPVFVSGVIAADGETVTITFDENVTGTESDTFTLDCDGVSGSDIAMTYASGSGTTALVFSSGETVQSTETCTVTFDGDPDDFVNDADIDLEDFGPESMTNNSEQGSSSEGAINQGAYEDLNQGAY